MLLRLITASLMRRSVRSVLTLSVLVMTVLCGVPLRTKALSSSSLLQRNTVRERVQQRIEERKEERKEEAPLTAANRRTNAPTEMREIGGLNVAVWKPSQGAGNKSPLIVFSHGFHGCNIQSTFLMRVLADAGYLVLAPNHKDALCGNGLRGLSLPAKSFALASSWNDTTYQDRRDDIKGLIDTLHRDSQWSSQIDWTRVALSGHSLGGYTVLGLAGGWPSWKISNIKAVLVLSPYCEPYAQKGALSAIEIPVMYQGGTLDLGITPFVKRRNGCFAKTSSPAIFVEFNGAGHFAWTDLDPTAHKLIEQYSLAFLDKYVSGSTRANPTAKQPGVIDLRVK